MSVLDQFRLDGRVAIVTGASSGLGAAFAEVSADVGAALGLGARRVARLEETKGKVGALCRRCLAVVARGRASLGGAPTGAVPGAAGRVNRARAAARRPPRARRSRSRRSWSTRVA